ncbi:MAG TPA: HAD-IIB family hydrolase [Candidatus Paceibacterota bacterium]|nr:HAD-IIB family hydrolase [Candidatus Paceibacterota bacterium]
MECPKVALFDLDNTLAEPFRPVSDAIAEAFGRLITTLPISIMTAASLERIQVEVLSRLSGDTDFSRLTLFTSNAGQSFAFDVDHWQEQYHFEFTDAQLQQIRAAIEEAIRETNALANTKVYGEQFIDYRGYFAFTALGIGAPVAERRAWDPDFSRRRKLQATVARKLPEFDVYIGGSTSIDVTLKGISKAYGIEWLSKRLNMAPADMLYVGDALYEGGNDFVVIKTGVRTKATSGPEETLGIINQLIAACAVK